MKKHLEGGTLRAAMADEVRRQILAHAGTDQALDAASLALGITSRTLRSWLAPVEKGGWSELDEFRGVGAMEKVLNVKPKVATLKVKAKAKKGAKNARKKTRSA
jgi:hypothetical protein